MHVVVAGGTSPTLGRSIVTACLSAGYQVTILSRTQKDSSTRSATKFGATVKAVQYDNVEDLKSAIVGSDVLVSVLKIIDADENNLVHLNLLAAAMGTESVVRFVPSDWSMYPLAHQRVDVLKSKSTLIRSCQEYARGSGRDDFEIAQFENGGFLNYFAQNAPSISTKPHLLGGLDDTMMLKYIDIASGTLRIPVDESGRPSKISMTHLDDIGHYVARSIALPPGAWPKSGIIIIAGCSFTFEDVQGILEKDCGLKLSVEKISAEDCDRDKESADKTLASGFTYDAFIAGMVAQMQRLLCSGEENGSWGRENLADRLPDIPRTDLRRYLIDTWASQ